MSYTAMLRHANADAVVAAAANAASDGLPLIFSRCLRLRAATLLWRVSLCAMRYVRAFRTHDASAARARARDIRDSGDERRFFLAPCRL